MKQQPLSGLARLMNDGYLRVVRATPRAADRQALERAYVRAIAAFFDPRDPIFAETIVAEEDFDRVRGLGRGAHWSFEGFRAAVRAEGSHN